MLNGIRAAADISRNPSFRQPGFFVFSPIVFTLYGAPQILTEGAWLQAEWKQIGKTGREAKFLSFLDQFPDENSSRLKKKLGAASSGIGQLFLTIVTGHEALLTGSARELDSGLDRELRYHNRRHAGSSNLGDPESACRMEAHRRSQCWNSAGLNTSRGMRETFA